MTHSPEAKAAALDASRAHWRANLAAETPNEAGILSEDCALCGLFYGVPDDESDADCRGCPVMRATGRRYCSGSPYIAAFDAFDAWRDNPTSPEAKAAWRVTCLAMCEFLERLDP